MKIDNGQVKITIRNNSGLTLPFALILTFIFSALVSVSYLFVSINLYQMQSSMQGLQAISIAEGINERIKARLNTKSKMQLSPEQEEKLKEKEDEESEDEEDAEDDIEEDFNEATEDFDEYYADEIVKISRYITFREPPQAEPGTEQGGRPGNPSDQESGQADQAAPAAPKPEENVEMIGNIDIPIGTVLNKGIMIVIFKDEKIDLMLKDITPEKEKIFREKLPVPIVKSLSPNYSEANKKGSFIVLGENILYNHRPRFTNMDIYIEDVKAGPLVEYFIDMDVMPGLTMFYWESCPTEFYIIPSYY